MTAANDGGHRDAIRRDEFTTCYQQHRDRLRRYAAWMAPHVDWESAVHDAFVKAYLNWDNITTSRGSWLTKVVYHNIVNLIRRHEQLVDAHEEFDRLCKSSERAQLLQRSRDGEEWHEVMQTFAATQELPPHLRVSVILRFEGSDDDEIARVLDVDRATVRRYVSKALRLIAEKVGNQERRLSVRRAVRPQPRDNRTPAQRTETP